MVHGHMYLMSESTLDMLSYMTVILALIYIGYKIIRRKKNVS